MEESQGSVLLMKTKEEVKRRRSKLIDILEEEDIQAEITLTPVKRTMLKNRVLLLDWVLE